MWSLTCFPKCAFAAFARCNLWGKSSHSVWLPTHSTTFAPCLTVSVTLVGGYRRLNVTCIALQCAGEYPENSKPVTVADVSKVT